MVGIELNTPIKAIREKLLFDHKIFIGASGTHTLRLLPSLNVKKRGARSVCGSSW